MAKIFETNLDVERDRLAKKADNDRKSSYSLFDGAIIGALVAMGSHTAEQLHQLGSLVLKQKPSSFVSGANNVLKWLGIFTAVAGVVRWFYKSTEATKTEAQAQMLGPEEIKYGNAVITPNLLNTPDSFNEMSKKYRELVSQSEQNQHLLNSKV